MERHYVAAFATLVVACVGALGCAQQAPLVRDEPVLVSDVSQEYDYVRKQRCSCGGGYEVVSQSVSEANGKHLDRLYCKCRGCGDERTFVFDVTSVFQELDLTFSKEAEKKAFDSLNRKYPKVSADHLQEFKSLLADRNPQVRKWAIDAIAQVGTPEAIGILLRGYMEAGILDSIAYGKGLEKVGPPVLPLVAERIAQADQEARFRLTSLLGDIKAAQSRLLLEQQLQRGPTDNRRVCYLSLGKLSYKESEAVLRQFLAREAPNPDDGLLWAIGRCGTAASIPDTRRYADSTQTPIRAAALVALGALGDRESIPPLLEVAAKDPDEDIRHSAIHALGLLKAKEAVPLLIEVLQTPSPSELEFHAWSGIYNDPDESYGHTGLNEAAIHALARIGDERALKAFERVLQDDRCYLDFKDVADAAASLNWRELVPSIIERMDKDYEDNVKLFGPDDERYSPALRKLTGQSFPEDPKLWKAWLDNQARPEIRGG